MNLAENLTSTVTWKITARVDNYLKWGNVLRTDIQPEAVYEFRKASRRLLVILDLFQAEYLVQDVRKSVKKWLKKFGPIRDLHVAATLDAGNESFTRLCEHLMENEYKRLFKKQDRLLNVDSKSRISDAVENIIMMVEADLSVFQLRMRYYWKSQYGRFLSSAPVPLAPDFNSLHKLRIRYKKLRYSTEFIEVSGFDRENKIRDGKYWQDLLGEIHDQKILIDIYSANPEMTLPDSLIQLSTNLRSRFVSRADEFMAFLDYHNAVMQQIL